MRTALEKRLRYLAAAFGSVLLAVVSIPVFVLLVVGVPLVVVWVGLPILLGAGAALRLLAGLYRRGAGNLLGEQIPTPYRPLPQASWFGRMRSVVTDPATWRDVMWLVYQVVFGLALSILSLVESILDFILWIKPAGLIIRLQALIARQLLGHNESTRLAQRVTELASSRSETIDSSAAELRRIERDLHDGAQARLVALGMNLGLAESQLDDNPAAARALVSEARAVSAEALNELRALVRGIHPPVLADRGLDGAVRALALTAPIPVAVDIRVAERLPAPVESAAYFAVAEGLTNVIKHSGAPHGRDPRAPGRGPPAHPHRRRRARRGQPDRGSGLPGIARRLSAFDGHVDVQSPPGGPTRLAMVLSCVSYSPKTLPSSGTA